jgi:hypothetical protein
MSAFTDNARAAVNNVAAMLSATQHKQDEAPRTSLHERLNKLVEASIFVGMKTRQKVSDFDAEARQKALEQATLRHYLELVHQFVEQLIDPCQDHNVTVDKLHIPRNRSTCTKVSFRPKLASSRRSLGKSGIEFNTRRPRLVT